MFQDKYRRDIEAVGPTAEQLGRLMAALEKEEERPVKTVKLTFKTVLIAACLCVALAMTALAVSPGLREALGAFWPYSQTIEGMVAVDQGIEVKVVSALSDGNVIRLYFTARDLEGDRLDEFTSTNFQMTPPSRTEGRWKSGTLYLPELVTYDSETKTALFTTGLVGGLAGNALSRRYNQGSKDILFRENGVTYYDSSYNVGPEDGPDVLPREVYGNIESGKRIKGTWKFEIPLENAEARTIDLAGSNTVLSGITGMRITLTSIGASVEGDPNGSSGTLGFPVTVFTEDGSRLHGTIDSNYYSPRYCSTHSSFPEPLDIHKVTGIALGLWYIPIEGDAAQPGRWLPELP